LRKLAAALFALPVVAALYVPVVLRRSIAVRAGLVLGGGAILALGAIGLAVPRGTAAIPPKQAVVVPEAAFRDIAVGQPVDGVASVEFSAPMDVASVEAALSVSPAADVETSWSADARTLTISPVSGWAPGTYYTVTVGADAGDEAGTALGRPARAVFLTRPSTVGRVLADHPTGQAVALDTAFVVTFDRPIDLGSAIAAFRIEPPIAGKFEVVRRTAADRLVYRPSEPLAPDTEYLVSFDGAVLRDADGAPLAEAPAVEVRTEEAPGVVRFRPRDEWTDVPREQIVSVRFTMAMDTAATTATFSVSVNGTAVGGRTRWAEGDTVLVLDPDSDFPYGAKVILAVSTDARSAGGTPLGGAAEATFAVEEKPVVRSGGGSAPVSTGGGSVGAATWSGVEKFYLEIMNCSRTGGLVTSSGACSSPGGSGRAALALDPGISAKVARPYAKYLANGGSCNHFLGGSPGDRLRRAGYDSYVWGENLGCRSGDPYAAVLGSHLFFQSERSYNGGHWRNIMDPDYDRVGIGVWVANGNVRLVVDFYHP
jgi:hypothetical protein